MSIARRLTSKLRPAAGRYRNISTGTGLVRTIVVVVLPRIKSRIGEWP